MDILIVLTAKTGLVKQQQVALQTHMQPPNSEPLVNVSYNKQRLCLGELCGTSHNFSETKIDSLRSISANVPLA